MVQIGPSSAASAQTPDTCPAALSDRINWYSVDFRLQSLEGKPCLHCTAKCLVHLWEDSVNIIVKLCWEKFAELKVFNLLRVFFYFDFTYIFSYNLSKFIVLISNLSSKPICNIKVRALDKVCEGSHTSLMHKTDFLILNTQAVSWGCHLFSSQLPQTNHTQQCNTNLDLDQGILGTI